MASILSNIERFFKQKSILSILILVNVAVFLLIKIFGLGAILFNSHNNGLLINLSLPAELIQILHKPWTLITYMFTHEGLWHILFNMLWLYWFGQMFEYFFGSRSLGSLYFLGGIAGAALYIIAYNIFPYFGAVLSNSALIGASASIMAIVFAVAFYKPDFQVRLFLIGNVKIIYIALILLVINLATLQTTNHQGEIVLNNAGGFFAHLGGFLIGIWYAQAYKKGKDITKGLNSFFDGIANLFKKKPKKSKMKVKYKRPETDHQYNARKKEESKEIDRILDKLKRSGYNGLTDEEKNKLFNAGK